MGNGHLGLNIGRVRLTREPKQSYRYKKRGCMGERIMKFGGVQNTKKKIVYVIRGVKSGDEMVRKQRLLGESVIDTKVNTGGTEGKLKYRDNKV